MQHLSVVLSPSVRDGLIPFYVQFYLKESAPLPSVFEEGLIYRHPERHEEAVVWAVSESEVFDILQYHYGNEWYGGRIMGIAHH